VRTPSVSAVAWSLWVVSMNWGCWLPGTPPIPVCGMKFGGQAYPVGEHAQQDRSGMPDQSVSVSGDLQGMSPGSILHAKGAPVWNLPGVVTRNLPGPERPSLLNP
jgi:hypothetical protein